MKDFLLLAGAAVLMIACTKSTGTSAGMDPLAAKRNVTVDFTDGITPSTVTLVGQQGQGTFIWNATGTKKLPDYGTYIAQYSFPADSLTSCFYFLIADDGSVNVNLAGWIGGTVSAPAAPLSDSYRTASQCR